MTSKTKFFSTLTVMMLLFTISCGVSAQQNDESIPMEKSQVEERSDAENSSLSGEESISGTVILRVNNKTFKGSTFSVDPTTPKSVWHTKNMEGMENEIPILALSMSSLEPKRMGVLVGFSGEEVNAKKLSGTFSLDPNIKNPFTITLVMDDNMKTFSFSSGTVTVDELSPESVKLTAKGAGLYADMEKQEYLDNQSAEVEIEMTFPNIMIDGKDIKRVDF
jgi:hypothetical protein